MWQARRYGKGGLWASTPLRQGIRLLKRIAFRCVCRYLVELEVISNSFSRYRTQALELTAHCAILKTLLSWDCKGNASAIIFAQDAMRIAHDSGHICLQLSASTKLAWAYLEGNERELALETASDARDLLKKYKEQRLPIGIRGGTWSTLSVMQARSGVNPDWAIKKASEQDMDNAIRYWKAAIEGAKRMKGEAKYMRALSLHDDMKKAFPGEKQIVNLRDHFRHSKDWK